MARHSGKNGMVKFDAGTQVTVTALTGWDIEESMSTSDTTAAFDDWESHDVTQKAWKGSIKMNADHGSDGQTLRAGDQLEFEGYTEGDGVGKTFYSGLVTIESHGIDSSYNGTVTRSYSIKGQGPLSIATVQA